MCVLVGCSPQDATLPMLTTVIPPDTFGDYIDQKLAQMDKHKGAIRVEIALPKNEYHPDELLEFVVTIMNVSERTIVVRRPEAELDYFVQVPLMEFLLVPSDPNISIKYILPIGDFEGFIEIPPSDFVVLSPTQSYTGMVPIIPRPRVPLPAGTYSVSAVYSNGAFGAFVNTDNELLLTDYDAWMGDVETNTITFEVVSE